MKNIIAVLLLALLWTNVKADGGDNTTKGKISGKVTDATTKLAVDYATVTVFIEGKPSPINGVITDPQGNFTIGKLVNGDYQITIDFIGYQKKIIDHVMITDKAPTVLLGNVAITPVANQLADVTIAAKRPVVENKIDKMVYNPQNDLTAQGGVAIDILKKVPMVTVDIDGNVELQGNANIRFLINGKPSSIFGASLTDALQSIPASQIKSIEVITSPGAKYDASGTGGIINIILKDSNVQGINGSVNLSAGTRFNNASVNLNAKKGNFGVNAFFAGNEQLNSTTINTLNRTSVDAPGNTTNLYQKGDAAFKRSGYQSGISFDWNVSKKDELTASFGFNHFGNNGGGTTNQEQTQYSPANTLLTDSVSRRNSTSNFSANSSDLSLSYKKTFNKKDQELDFLVVSTFGNNRSGYTQEQDYLTGIRSPSGVIGNSPGTDKETDISVDYTQPLAKGFELETGAKAIIENIHSSIATDTLLSDGTFGPNANQTYGFNYQSKIFAYYLSGSFTLFNDFIDGKAGLRYEYTSINADFPNTHIPDYGILAPSFVLQHKINESESIKFAYSYRLERPDYNGLNPFYNISDSHNISTGNPNLKPELGHNFELGYNINFDKGSTIYFAGFYRYNTDDIQSFTTFYPTLNVNGTEYTNVFLSQRDNIGEEKMEGANLYVSVPVTGKFSLRSNMFVADRITSNPGLPTVSGVAYRINLNASYDFGHNLAAEVFGNYRSSQIGIQGKNPAFAFYNIAVRKQFWNKNASIGITAANPFNMYVNQTSTLSSSNYSQVSLRQVPLRSFGISLSYKFGKLEFKKDKEDNNNPNVPAEN